MVRDLCDRGADLHSTSATGLTALQVACKSVYLPVVRELCRRGA